MAQLPSIPNIIKYAKISEYLAENDITKSNIFFNGSLDRLLPVKIYESRLPLEWAYNLDYKTRAATANFLVNYDSSINDGDTITVLVDDPILGEIVIGEYIIQSTDTSGVILAQNLAAAINGYGYSATTDGIMVIVTAPLALGSSINGIFLSIEYTAQIAPINDYLLINDTDTLMINATDKFIL